MALLMTVAKQTVLGTGRAITRHDCWNKMSASRAVLYLKMDHSAGEGHHRYQYRQLVRSKFWCVGPSSLFHTELLYVAHSFETTANLLGEDQTRAQITKQFLISPYLFDSSIFMKSSAVMQNIRAHQCSLQFVQGCVKKPGMFPLQCLIKW